MTLDDKPHDECGIIGIYAPNEDRVQGYSGKML